MIKLRLWAWRLLEWLRRAFFGVQRPPDRLAAMCQFFFNAHPNASPEQWLAFSVQMAGEAYTSGYLRGMSFLAAGPREDEHAMMAWTSSPTVSRSDEFREGVEMMEREETKNFQAWQTNRAGVKR